MIIPNIWETKINVPNHQAVITFAHLAAATVATVATCPFFGRCGRHVAAARLAETQRPGEEMRRPATHHNQKRCDALSHCSTSIDHVFLLSQQKVHVNLHMHI